MMIGPDAAEPHHHLPRLSILDTELVIHRFGPDESIPEDAFTRPLFSITRTDSELSIVCDAAANIESPHFEADWRAIRLEGPLDFSLIGILARIAGLLANASISIFAISTYDTDYILLKEKHLTDAMQVLESNGYTFISRK